MLWHFLCGCVCPYMGLKWDICIFFNKTAEIIKDQFMTLFGLAVCLFVYSPEIQQTEILQILTPKAEWNLEWCLRGLRDENLGSSCPLTLCVHLAYRELIVFCGRCMLWSLTLGPFLASFELSGSFGGPLGVLWDPLRFHWDNLGAFGLPEQEHQGNAISQRISVWMLR